MSSQVVFGQLVVGLINGSFYALLSLGFAIIVGLLGIINVAQGTLLHARRVRLVDAAQLSRHRLLVGADPVAARRRDHRHGAGKDA